MQRAALVPVIRTITGNKTVRRVVRRGGKLAWNAALSAIQARRKRRGKPILFPRGVQPIWTSSKRTSGGSRTVVRREVPVRSDYTVGNLRKDMSLSDTTTTSLTLPLSSQTFTVSMEQVTVRDAILFPNSDLTSYNYSLYDITSMIFEFIPQLGTSYTGNVMLAFTKSMTETEKTQTYDTCALMPVSVDTPVHEGCKLLVTAEHMNHGPQGKGLIIDPTDAEAGALQNFYSGCLFLATKNVGLNGTPVSTNVSLGRIQLTYVLTLRQAQAPNYPGAWVRAPSIEDDAPIITRGIGGTFKFVSAAAGDVNYKVHTLRGGYLMLIRGIDGVHGFGLKIDTVATAAEITLANLSHEIYWYPLTPGWHDLQLLPGADFPDFEMSVHSRAPLS